MGSIEWADVTDCSDLEEGKHGIGRMMPPVDTLIAPRPKILDYYGIRVATNGSLVMGNMVYQPLTQPEVLLLSYWYNRK